MVFQRPASQTQLARYSSRRSEALRAGDNLQVSNTRGAAAAIENLRGE
jgi:hypothetical protein